MYAFKVFHLGNTADMEIVKKKNYTSNIFEGKVFHKAQKLQPSHINNKISWMIWKLGNITICVYISCNVPLNIFILGNDKG